MSKIKTNEKTNVMRILDSLKIDYTPHYYVESGETNGMKIAAILNEEPEKVFKTLVTKGNSGEHYIFVIPVNKELNLKKAAKVVGEKSIEMIKSKELLPLTGYVHGGCSPIGMKKFFVTTIDQTAENSPYFYFSGGKIGYQVEMSVESLKQVIPFTLADLT